MKKVVLDAGHGEPDVGAVGNGLHESKVVLKLSKIVEEKLSRYEVEIKQTRATANKVELSQRTKLSNDWGADIFVSLHTNAWNTQDANGVEIIYYPNSNSGENLATDIGKQLFSVANLRLRHTNGYVERDNLAVIRDTVCPAILIELGFITNKSDSDKLKDDRWLGNCADAIVKGIEKNLGLKLKQSAEPQWKLIIREKTNSPDVWIDRIEELMKEQPDKTDKYWAEFVMALAK